MISVKERGRRSVLNRSKDRSEGLLLGFSCLSVTTPGPEMRITHLPSITLTSSDPSSRLQTLIPSINSVALSQSPCINALLALTT